MATNEALACGSVDVHDLSSKPDQIGSEEGDVTGAATDIENTHAVG